MLKQFSSGSVAFVIAALAFTAACGDNLSSRGDADGGVDAAGPRRTATTVGNVAHASSPHFRLYASLSNGEASSASAHFAARGPVTGGGQ